MFCEYCGNNLVDNAKFCNKCGKPVKQTGTAEAAGDTGACRKREAEKAAEGKGTKADKGKKAREREKNGKLLAVLIVVVLLLLGASVGMAALLLSDGDSGIFSLFDREKEADEEEDDGNDKDEEEIEDATETETAAETEAEAASATEAVAATETAAEAVQTTETTVTGEKVAWGRNTDYILPDSSTRALAEEDFGEIGEDAEKLRIARNEIYARHGRMFSDEELQAYFDAKDWYTGTIAPEDFTDDMLSQIERDNLIIIKEYESKLEERE